MVWELVPLNSSTGASKYFFTSQGTYKVGRKDCAVTIQTDKTISRVHAEITLEAASSWNSLQCFSNIPYPEICLRDVSKFGTFINKETGSKPIFSLANRETMLKNGDVITFGTNNTTFRLSYVPFLFCIPPTENLKPKHFIQKTVSSIGAYATEKWRAECTHLIVEDSSPITNDVMDAIVAKKPIVLCDWLQVMVGQTCSFAEIPSCASFAPTLILKPGQASIPVKIADSMLRETCFHGFTFVVGPLHLYHYKERLQLLLEVAGATVVPVAKRCSSTQNLADASKEREVLIIPAERTRKDLGLDTDKFHHIHQISRMSEDKVVVAIFSGEFNVSTLEAPSSPVPSSSTEETVDVADSEDEMDVATTHKHAEVIDSRGGNLTGNDKIRSPVAGEGQIVSYADEMKGFTSVLEVKSARRDMGESSSKRGIADCLSSQTSLQFKAITNDKECLSICGQSVEVCGHRAMETASTSAVKVDNESQIERKLRDVDSDSSEFEKSDILYARNLIVRKDWDKRNSKFSLKEATPNFKCFRKKTAISGNSFNDLIPFAKDPYKESDYGREMAEYVREEKKRKEAEALAEDLFNAERIKRQRGTAGASILETHSQRFHRQKVR